jgi:hypothetical protein
MKPALLLFASALLMITSVGCDKKGADAEASASAASTGAKGGAASGKGDAKPTGPAFKTKMMGTDMVQPLVAMDLIAPLAGLTITAPEKAKMEESRGALKLVAAGVNYSISIREGKYDKAESLKTFKLVDEKGTVADESDTHLIFKRESGSHLLSAAVTVGDKTYVCHSVATAANFTREEIDQTLTSCRSLKKK